MQKMEEKKKGSWNRKHSASMACTWSWNIVLWSKTKVKMKSKQTSHKTTRMRKHTVLVTKVKNTMILERKENLPMTVRWTVKWQSRNTEQSRCVEDKQMCHSWFWWRNECVRKRGKSDVRWDLSVHALRP